MSLPQILSVQALTPPLPEVGARGCRHALNPNTRGVEQSFNIHTNPIDASLIEQDRWFYNVVQYDLMEAMDANQYLGPKAHYAKLTDFVARCK